MRYFLTGLLILQVFSSYGQMSLHGNVTDASTKKPLNAASVFFGNTSIGSTTDAQGDFTLKNIPPGQYDLIVSMVGYETYVQHIASQKIEGKISIRLKSKPVMMPVVSVMSKAERQRLLAMFIRDFVGNAKQAGQCRIVNTNDITLEYDHDANQLNASTEDFLVIENKPLGYRLKFLIKQFNSNYTNQLIYYEGQALFEEMKGGETAKKRWQKNRRETYYGSPMHFLRSIIHANGQGFVMRKLERKPNPDRPADSLIRQKLKQHAANADSMEIWGDRSRMPKYIQTLYNTPLTVNQVAARTDVQGVFALKFTDLLYVTYPPKKQSSDEVISIRDQPLNGDAAASIIKLEADYALFDNNGIIFDPHSVMYEGVWSAEKIGHLLPNNYEP